MIRYLWLFLSFVLALGGNARAADLWGALEEASGRRVAAVVRTWIEREGFPLVSVEQADRAGRSE